MNVLSTIVSLVSGNSKMSDGLRKAVEIANSGKYSHDMNGAMRLAKDFGFDRAAFQKMESLSHNPKLIHAIGLVAPGAADKLQSMFNQLSNSYLSSESLPQEKTYLKNTDDFSERMKRLNF